VRSNSGSGESKDNNRDPTLRDKELAQGRSGEAVHHEEGRDKVHPSGQSRGSPESGTPDKH
jgi:hypothetical protein